MKLRITHYCSDRSGGAARAALRLHSAYQRQQIFSSTMVVAVKPNDDHSITELSKDLKGRLTYIVKSAIDAVPRRISALPDCTPRSAGWASIIKAKDINSHPSDIAHLHWINSAFLSIEEIGKISIPIVWSLHDMWPFCGSEHLASDALDARWRSGYKPRSNIRGFDFDRWVWRRKKASWTKPFQIVTPSRWLADCVRQSHLLKDFPVHIIPNALDVEVYKPMNKAEARHLLNLPQNRKLILFGAIKGTQLPYKGWDLLMPALEKVSYEFPGADAVIFGQGKPAEAPQLNLFIHWMGHLHDDFTLAALYSAADLLVIPSRQESFGQTGSEAQSCGCPVVAFNSTGLKDVVENNETGLLVKPYDSAELASAIIFALRNDNRREQYGAAARKRALNLWSYSTVATQYNRVYDEALKR